MDDGDIRHNHDGDGPWHAGPVTAQATVHRTPTPPSERSIPDELSGEAHERVQRLQRCSATVVSSTAVGVTPSLAAWRVLPLRDTV
jgi:hypothetical protein